MRIQAEIRYSRPPADVSTMTFDERFQDAKCLATGALTHTAAISAGDSAGSDDGSGENAGRTITTDRTMPTNKFPDFVRSYVGSSLTITQVDSWGPAQEDGVREGTIVVSVASMPIKLTGTLSLRPAPGGAVMTVDGNLKASIPLIGGRVEKAAAPAILAAVKAEERTAVAWFAGDIAH
jgi:hypothetical protein